MGLDSDFKLKDIASATPAAQDGVGFDENGPVVSLTALDSRDMNRLGKRQELNVCHTSSIAPAASQVTRGI